MRHVRRAAVLALPFLALACGESNDGDGDTTSAQASGALCDPAITDAQGQQFLDLYCVACHSVSRSGAGRNGAPSDVNFDDTGSIGPNSSIIVHGHHADELAAGGPNRINRAMPPLGVPATAVPNGYPSDSERREFGSWLACKPLPVE